MTDWTELDPDQHAALCASLLPLDGSTPGTEFEVAWEALYYRFRNLVVWMVTTSSYGLSRQDVEDITQDVFLRLHQNLRNYRGESFKGWLRRMAYSARSDWFRANRAEAEHRTLVDDLRKLVEVVHVDQPDMDRLAQLVMERLHSLSTGVEQRMLEMLLREASIREVCVELGVTEYQVKKVRLQARDVIDEVVAAIHVKP